MAEHAREGPEHRGPQPGGIAFRVDVVAEEDEPVERLDGVDPIDGRRGGLQPGAAVSHVSQDGQVEHLVVGRERLPGNRVGGAALSVGGVPVDLVAVDETGRDETGAERRHGGDDDAATTRAVHSLTLSRGGPSPKGRGTRFPGPSVPAGCEREREIADAGSIGT
jgi:hypothetical protein